VLFRNEHDVVSLFPYLLALCTGGGTRRISNCSLLTTAWTMAETL
jgi:hypothetical protein